MMLWNNDFEIKFFKEKLSEKFLMRNFSANKEFGLYAIIYSVVCKKLGLTKETSSDLAFCTTDKISQLPENIKIIFEIRRKKLSLKVITNNIER